tara:strand:+ start:705 stop:1421 length:717 start_codon:yes stop_codon:yes gene_type:complete
MTTEQQDGVQALEGVTEEQATSDAGTQEVDYKVEYERLKAEKATLEQRVKSAEGRLRPRMDENVTAQLNAISKEQRRLTREVRRSQLENADLDEGERRRSLGQIEQEEQQETDQAALVRHSSWLVRTMQRQAERAKVPSDHAGLQAFVERWGRAQTADDYDDIYDDFTDFLEEDARKKAEEARQRFNVLNDTMGTGGGPSTPAGGSADWDKVRAAYAENPYDTKISQRYNTMRRARGI